MEMKWKLHPVNAETELEWAEDESEADKALTDAAILIPEDSELSEDAVETIRHMRYYRNGREAIALFSDYVGVMLDAAPVKDVIEAAESARCAVLGSMPDFTPYNMDDGCGLVMMTDAVFGFRPYGVASGYGLPTIALDVRQDILEASAEEKLIAIVYNSREDYESFNR